MSSLPSEKDKKRKRREEKDGRPRKKKSHREDAEAIANGNTPAQNCIKLTHVPKDDHFMLVVASTPGITVPSDISLQAYHRGSELLLHSSDHPHIDYTAREQQDGGIEEEIKHYIGIYDPEKKEMQIVEAKKMSVRSTLRKEEEELQRNQQVPQSSVLSERQKLGLEFGTKKAKKAINSLADNAVTSISQGDLNTVEGVKKSIQQNPSAAAVIKSMAEGAANAPSKEALQAVIDNAKPRPKHNINATRPEDVYTIDELVGDDVMRLVKVKPWFDAIEEKKEVKTMSRFVSHRLKSLVEDDDVKRTKVLKYLLILMQFFLALKKGHRGAGKKVPKRDELLTIIDVDPVLLDTIRKTFTGDSSDMTKWHVDNLLTHIAALALIVDGFETDTHDLREDLRLPRKDMDQYFRETGAKVVSMSKPQRERMKISQEEAVLHKIAKLVVPLQFPKERVIPRKP